MDYQYLSSRLVYHLYQFIHINLLTFNIFLIILFDERQEF